MTDWKKAKDLGLYDPNAGKKKARVFGHRIPETPMPQDTLDTIIRLVKDANRATCADIVDPNYWNDEWTECPLCGCKPDGDGLWVHNQMQ